MRDCIPRIPVTRLTDLTPLDRLRLPVFCAVTPLARDLTTHFGKGVEPDAARASALMEAVERASAERFGGASLQGSFDELVADGRSVVDPTVFDLADDTAFRRDHCITWVEAIDLLQDVSVWLPLDLAINPPIEGVLRDVDTNGLAAGNTMLEAVLHGLCEVVERDAVGQRLFATLFAEPKDGLPLGRRIDPGSLSGPAADWLARITELGHGVVITDITTEIGLPTFQSVLFDDAYPSATGLEMRRFPGHGADPCADVAVLRSMTEAVQARLGVVQGARDSFNRLPASRREAARQADLDDFRSMPMVALADVPNFESDDLREDLQFVLGRLRRAGVDHVLAVDLTRADLGIPVVRVRVPGLTSFLVNQRRVGWRCLRYLL